MAIDTNLTSVVLNPWSTSDTPYINSDQIQVSYSSLGFIASASDSYKSTAGDIFKVFIDGKRVYRSSDALYAGGENFLETGDSDNSTLSGVTGQTWSGSTSDTVWAIDVPNQKITIDTGAIAATSLYGSSGGAAVSFSSGVTIIEVVREVQDQASPAVDFSNASILTEQDLDNSSSNVFHMAQQAIETANKGLTYNVGTSAYEAYQPGTSVKRKITQVADPVSDYDAVNKSFISTNLPNITTVAGIAGNVTTVAGISANVTTVAGVSENVTTVATNIASVNTVATDIAKVIVVADDLSEAISEIETAALDLQETTSEIDTVSNSIANVNTVGLAITNVNTVGTNIANVNKVGVIDANVTKVANIDSNVTKVADIDANVTKVANIDANVTKVADIDGNVTTVAGLGTSGVDVTTVAGKATEIGRLGTSDMSVGTDAYLKKLGVDAFSNASTGYLKLVGDIDDKVTTVAGISANVTTVATNIADVNNFAALYQIDDFSPSAPTTDGSEASLADGDLAYDTTANRLKVYESSAFVSIGLTTAESTVIADNSATAMAIALG